MGLPRLSAAARLLPAANSIQTTHLCWSLLMDAKSFPGRAVPGNAGWAFWMG